jgi:spermidine dehydrogenase
MIQMDNASQGDNISRRDFLNGMLLASGGAAISSFFPLRVFAHLDVGRNACNGSLGIDPRALRGGNIPSVFNVGHWLRDGCLAFCANHVHLGSIAEPM